VQGQRRGEVPSATLYKSLAFQVYMQGGSYIAPNTIKMQNFSTCPLSGGDWDTGCCDRAAALGADSSARSWASTKGSTTNHWSGHTVRGLVSVYGGSYYIYKARAKVTYGILK
jgi:hypothetical protein